MASEEEEEYYDSIDDSELEQCRSFCNEQFYEDDSEIEDDNSKINDMVPLYDGEVIKSEFLKQDSNTNSEVTLRNTKLKRRNPVISLPESTRKNRSYLTMFYARYGGQQAKQESDAQKANSGESSADNFSGENNDLCESQNLESMYETDMEKGNNELEHSLAHGTHSSVAAASCRYQSQLRVNSSQIFSLSEAHFNSAASSRQRKQRDKGGKGGTKKPLKLGELGGLGPNIASEKFLARAAAQKAKLWKNSQREEPNQNNGTSSGEKVKAGNPGKR